jgi:molybdate transport system permease protein
MFNFLESIKFEPFILSFKLALIVTVLLFIISLPLAWYLSQTKSKIKPLLEAVTAMPIVLPPSVLGFYLLILLSPESALGGFFEQSFGVALLFSFWGLVVASMVYSLPFMVQPLQSGFESLNRSMIEASFVSGKGSLATLFWVALPNIKPSLITASIITFAHTIGEFGVVLMVGGSIPNETKVASVAIYELVESMDYKMAHIYSSIMVLVSFLTLLIVYITNRSLKQKRGV